MKILTYDEFIGEGLFHKIINKKEIDAVKKDIKIAEQKLSDLTSDINKNQFQNIDNVKTLADVSISTYAPALYFKLDRYGKPDVEQSVEKEFQNAREQLTKQLEANIELDKLNKKMYDLQKDDEASKACDASISANEQKLKFMKWFNEDGKSNLGQAVYQNALKQKDDAKEYMKDFLNGMIKNCPFKNVIDNIKDWYKDII